MKPHSDFEEFLKLLEDHNVEYLIVGGYAVAFYGYPRFTKDLDIFYLNDSDNIEKLKKVLILFGFDESVITREALSQNGNIITFGLEPLRVDLMNEIDGVDYERAKHHSQRGTYGETDVTFIGKDALLLNKKATPRIRDKGDVDELEKRSNDI